jgi:outer membrane protein
VRERDLPMMIRMLSAAKPLARPRTAAWAAGRALLRAAAVLAVALAFWPSARTWAAPQNEPGLDSLTVEQAVGLALANHPAVVAAQEALQAAEARIETSRSPFYPDVSFGGSYARIAPVPEFVIPGLGSEKLAPDNNYDIYLGVRQLVYDFGRTEASVDLARSGRNAAADHVDQVKFNLAYRTISVFNSILILRAAVGVLEDQIRDLGQHLDVSRKKVRAGTATDFDVLTTRVRIAAAENDLIDAATGLDAQEIAFRQLTGLPDGASFGIRGEFTRRPVELDSSVAVAAAFERRPEIVGAQDAERSAALQVRLVSLGDRPSVGVSLNSGFMNGYPDNLNQLKANYAAGVHIQVPVFNGFRTRNMRLEAEANLRSVSARTEDLRRQVSAEVNQAISRTRAAWEKTLNAEVLVRQAEDAVSMAEIKYQAGVATNLDVLDAETTLTQARLTHLRALYAYSISLVEFDRATGRRVW